MYFGCFVPNLQPTSTPTHSLKLVPCARSASCIPLWPLPHVHAFLLDTKSSWLVHMGERERLDLAADAFAANEYELGSQWFVLTRRHAERAAAETKTWAKYRTYCEVTGEKGQGVGRDG